MNRLIALFTFLFCQLAFSNPIEVKKQIIPVENKFNLILNDECPDSQCYSKGCRVIGYDIMDHHNNSSLPGLGSTNNKAQPPQYLIKQVRCDYTYEASLAAATQKAINKRLFQRLSNRTFSLDIRGSKLAAVPTEVEVAKEPLVANASESNSILNAMLPFLPWFAFMLLLTFLGLLMLYGFRTFGKPKPITPKATESATPAAIANTPSPMMLMDRIAQIKNRCEKDTSALNSTVKDLLESKDLQQLSLLIKHFGLDILGAFKQNPQYKETLAELSKHYSANSEKLNSADLWEFLDNFERSLTAAEIQIQQTPITDEFAFLSALSVEQLVSLLKDMNEKEAITVVTNAPTGLREAFFAAAPANFTTKLVEKLTTIDRIPDSFARECAAKLKQRYDKQFDQLQVTKLDHSAMMESALNHLAHDQRSRVLADMAKENPQVLEKLAPKIFLDESLAHLDSVMLTETFLEVSPKEAAHYLKGHQWGDQVLSKLNPKVKSNIVKFWAQDVDLTLVNKAREKIAHSIRGFDAKGNINLKNLNMSLLKP